ncbi:hypothetical protein [Streptomyces sp. NBC_01264]|uniref:hypothetical protein n=1 Tax=Streptomyces sp. NBC_01264 TaxID=2903804 RepID=UPI0022560EB6|nr:hypothetical protein [Streptomyces sp. NBC_01264]
MIDQITEDAVLEAVFPTYTSGSFGWLNSVEYSQFCQLRTSDSATPEVIAAFFGGVLTRWDSRAAHEAVANTGNHPEVTEKGVQIPLESTSAQSLKRKHEDLGAATGSENTGKRAKDAHSGELTDDKFSEMCAKIKDMIRGSVDPFLRRGAWPESLIEPKGRIQAAVMKMIPLLPRGADARDAIKAEAEELGKAGISFAKAYEILPEVKEGSVEWKANKGLHALFEKNVDLGGLSMIAVLGGPAESSAIEKRSVVVTESEKRNWASFKQSCESAAKEGAPQLNILLTKQAEWPPNGSIPSTLETLKTRLRVAVKQLCDIANGKSDNINLSADAAEIEAAARSFLAEYDNTVVHPEGDAIVIHEAVRSLVVVSSASGNSVIDLYRYISGNYSGNVADVGVDCVAVV